MPSAVTDCRFDKFPFDSAQGLSMSNGKALSQPKRKARATWLLPASDGSFYFAALRADQNLITLRP